MVFSPARRWAFRIAIVVLAPLLVVSLPELVLRVIGYGYPTSFFLPTLILGRNVYIENDRFGLRFFPPELARSPSPMVMAAEKPPGNYRIFIFGESAALGDPEPAYSMGRYLQVLLQDRYPGAHFEVVCTAMTAINSHVILPIARECARRQGDIWLIYIGNNEFVGPFGAATVFGPQAPQLALIRLNIKLKSLRLGQWLAKFAIRPSKQERWGGMKMFLDNQVGPEDPRRGRVYNYFRRNLEDIIECGQDAGAKVLVSTVAANLKDCAPFASEHRAGLSDSQQAAWKQLYDSGIAAQNSGRTDQAISNFNAAAQIDPLFAELQFRLGQCYFTLTNSAQARSHFGLARDCDSLPFRADSRLNEIIRQTAVKESAHGVVLVDGAAALESKSAQNITGDEVLFEHVHLNFNGNYLLARAFAEQVAKCLPEAITRAAAGHWATPELCARSLALTDWDRQRVYESLLRRLAEPPFINQTDHATQLAVLRDNLLALRPGLTTVAAKEARAVYAHAIAAMPDDFYLHADFAKLQEDTGDLPDAILAWQHARDLIPFAPGPYYYAGKLLARAGRSSEALESLTRALEIRPDLPDALDEKGRLLVQQKRAEEGLALIDKAIQYEPANPLFCIHKAETLAALGRHEEALGALRTAISLDPGFWEARYLLAVELAVDGDVFGAAGQFREVIRLSPANISAHLNLAIALAKLDHIDEAKAEFRETLRLDPQNRKAANYLNSLDRLGGANKIR